MRCSVTVESPTSGCRSLAITEMKSERIPTPIELATQLVAILGPFQLLLVTLAGSFIVFTHSLSSLASLCHVLNCCSQNLVSNTKNLTTCTNMHPLQTIPRTWVIRPSLPVLPSVSVPAALGTCTTPPTSTS